MKKDHNLFLQSAQSRNQYVLFFWKIEFGAVVSFAFKTVGKSCKNKNCVCILGVFDGLGRKFSSNLRSLSFILVGNRLESGGVCDFVSKSLECVESIGHGLCVDVA